MKIGAITNTWQVQLSTTSLPQLVERARRRGAEHVELRQTCLGTFEQGGGENWTPDSHGLSRLVRTFPMTTFNLAVAYPCLSSEDPAPSGMFHRALDTAVEMAGSSGPHLRLVDPVRFDASLGGAWGYPRGGFGREGPGTGCRWARGEIVHRKRRPTDSQHGDPGRCGTGVPVPGRSRLPGTVR